MGCCHQRSTGLESETKQLKENSFEYLTDESSSELKQIADTTLVEYLKMCREKHNWEVICSLISNKQSIFDIKPSPSWAFRPRTIGCLALQYLSRGSKRYAQEVILSISKILPALMEIIASGTLDKVEQSVLLISYLLITGTSEIKDALVELKFFDAVIPHFLSEKFEFRQACAITCARTYKGSVKRQQAFVAAQGVVSLMQVISLGPLRGRFFSELVQCVIDIIEVSDRQDEGNEPSQQNVKDILVYIDWNLVNNIDISLMSDHVREKFFKLITLLQAFNTPQTEEISNNL